MFDLPKHACKVIDRVLGLSLFVSELYLVLRVLVICVRSLLRHVITILLGFPQLFPDSLDLFRHDVCARYMHIPVRVGSEVQRAEQDK